MKRGCEICKMQSQNEKKLVRKIRNKEDDDEIDDTVVRRKVCKVIQSDNPDEESEKVRLLDDDIAERDAFVNRLIEREEKHTRKLTSQEGLSADQIKELATKGAISTSKDLDAVERLREISRQLYLEKREEKELKLLELSMKDEEYLFDDVELTAEEKKRLELNKKILAMASDKYRFNYKDDGYHMPDGYEDERGRINKEKRDALLTARYEAEEELKTEQELWEEDQVKIATVKFGSKDQKEKLKVDNYDYVFE